MFDASEMLYLYVETPLHAGSGASLGVVDLPIQRERVTHYPMVQASGIKGKLRAESYGLPKLTEHEAVVRPKILSELLNKLHADAKWNQKSEEDRQKAESEAGQQADLEKRRRAAQELGYEAVFGPDTNHADDHAGAFSPGDARLLLFPVRSLAGVFAWTTSRDVLARFHRDAATLRSPPDWQPFGPSAETEAMAAPGNEISFDGTAVLEEFTFSIREDAQVRVLGEWIAQHALPQEPEYDYWRSKLPGSLVILHENAFRDFTQFSTEVISRIRLNHATKTTAPGALWSEEHLPSDTLLYSPLFATGSRVDMKKAPHSWSGDSRKVLEKLKELSPPRIQLGGDETVGRGIVKLRFS